MEKFTKRSPQEMGIIVANAEANKYPDDSQEKERLLKIRNDGLDALEERSDPNNGNFPGQGRINSRKKKNS